MLVFGPSFIGGLVDRCARRDCPPPKQVHAASGFTCSPVIVFLKDKFRWPPSDR